MGHREPRRREKAGLRRWLLTELGVDFLEFKRQQPAQRPTGGWWVPAQCAASVAGVGDERIRRS